METTTTTTEYRGRTITTQPGHWNPAYTEALIDGKRFYGNTHDNAAKAVAWAQRAVDTWEQNDAIEPTLIRTCRVVADAEWDTLPEVTAATLVAGSVVAIYGRGNLRTALVLKVGRKNAEVAFTTPTAIAQGTNQITRKSVSFQHIRLLEVPTAPIAVATPARVAEPTPTPESAPAGPLATQVQALRAEGLSWRAIGERVGVAHNTARRMVSAGAA